MFVRVLLLVAALCVDAGSFANENPGPSGSFDKGSSDNSGSLNPGGFGDSDSLGVFDKGTSGNSGSFGKDKTKDEKELRDMIKGLDFEFDIPGLTYEYREEFLRARTVPSGGTCKLPGDDFPNSFEYCSSILNMEYDWRHGNPDPKRERWLKVGKISVDGTSATVNAKYHVRGYVKLLMFDQEVSTTRKLVLLCEKVDGQWKVAEFNFSGDMDKSLRKDGGEFIMNSLRDAVIVVGQKSGYDPISIISGAVVACGFVTIATIGVCILARRRRYQKVTTAIEV